jgi:hypothetical protein
MCADMAEQGHNALQYRSFTFVRLFYRVALHVLWRLNCGASSVQTKINTWAVLFALASIA